MISPQKINLLLFPFEMRKIFKKRAKEIGIPPQKIKKVKIKVIKEYIDWRSFSLVALYSLGNQRKIIGIANSDNKKEYAFRMNKLVFNHLSKKSKYLTAQPYCYIKSLGLFLEEYLEGENFGKTLKENRAIKNIQIKRLAELLFYLQKANFSKAKIKTGINFCDIKKNIRILKKKKEGRLTARIFKKVSRKIRNYERRNKNKVLVHGDLNPYNFFFEKDKIKIIDFSSTHLGDRVSDLANIFAHLETTLDFNISAKKEKLFEDSLLKAYQEIAGKFNKLEREKLEVYKKYFNLLNISHVFVWGGQPQRRKLAKEIKKLTS